MLLLVYLQLTGLRHRFTTNEKFFYFCRKYIKESDNSTAGRQQKTGLSQPIVVISLRNNYHILPVFKQSLSNPCFMVKINNHCVRE